GTGSINSVRELTAFFDSRVRQLKNRHLYEACAACEHLGSGLCGGGCFVYRLAGRDTAGEALFPLDDNNCLLKARPRRSPRICLWESNTGEKLVALAVSGPAGRAILSFQDGENRISFFDLIRACDGQHTVRDLLNRWASRFENRDMARDAILYAVRLCYYQGAIEI
ncbi:MAG: hypothetical protein MI892_13615, partial [Desulfobacterales bacterium]|nr:hypothetical protein [Desulfobacterales bacterium]